jgi:uncharacterized iron-regulated membrane protein
MKTTRIAFVIAMTCLGSIMVFSQESTAVLGSVTVNATREGHCLHPLHNGEAFGWIGRWLVFLVAWIPAVLWITGLIRWRQKVKAKKYIIHRKV